MEKEVVEKFYDELSETYEKTHSDRFVDRIFEHFLRENLPKAQNMNILDAGGAIGRFSFFLSKLGHKITLTDISGGMVKKAEEIAKKHNLKDIRFFRESVNNMYNQENEMFDVVLMMNGILDYCKDHKKAMQETNRVLKDKGHFIGTVNNRYIYTTMNVLFDEKNIDSFRKAFKTGNRVLKFKTHDFTLEELKEELKNAGFELLKIYGPTNLLRKWEYDDLLKGVDEKELLELQIEFAKKKEYLNNSTDFFFVARKL